MCCSSTTVSCILLWLNRLVLPSLAPFLGPYHALIFSLLCLATCHFSLPSTSPCLDPLLASPCHLPCVAVFTTAYCLMLWLKTSTALPCFLPRLATCYVLRFSAARGLPRVLVLIILARKTSQNGRILAKKPT